MPLRLPRLTLFTGPQCSLCQIAKGELAKVRLTHPFDLDTVNIYDEKGKHWQKQYAWWIPALHLEGKEIAKGRWDQTTVREALEAWNKQEHCSKDQKWTAHREFIYDRCDVTLGANTGKINPEDLESRKNRCFNCGSPEHVVGNCTKSLNRSLIALSRAMYNFFKTAGETELVRLHEYEERKKQRLHLSQSLEAGFIREDLLRDALGLNEPDNQDDEAELPWLKRMLQWGYPPGWVGEEDPKLKIRARIEGQGIWETEAASVTVFDDCSQASNSSDSNADSDDGYRQSISSPTDCNKTRILKRWVHYPTTLFSSEHLAIYTGIPLPLINNSASSTFTSDRQLLWQRIVSGGQPPPVVTVQESQVGSMPPWRHPGAFSAFGPVDWQECTHAQLEWQSSAKRPPSRACSSHGSVGESDMDLSE